MSDHLSTQELISDIERNDRRFRMSVTVLLVIIGLAIGVMLFLQYQALERFKSQAARNEAENSALQKTIKEETQKTNRYLQCIAQYFANPDRADTTIKSIDDCTIDKTTGALVPGLDSTPLASNGSGSDSDFLAPGPAPPGQATNPPVRRDPIPENPNPTNPPPPRGVIPFLMDGLSGLIDRARGILGL